MEKIITLTDYDIFAYLMVGIAVLAASDLVLGSRFVFRNQWGFGIVTMMVISAYVLGQILAGPAELILEQIAVRQFLKTPVHYLVLTRKQYEEIAEPDNDFVARCNDRYEQTMQERYFITTVLSYFQPLSCVIQQQIRKDKKSIKDGQELFYEAYAIARNDDKTAERLGTFSRLYIFCRNMAFAALLAAVAVLFRWRRGRCAHWRALEAAGLSPWLTYPRWQFAIFATAAVALFFRYVFFYRLYSVEVLTAFATLK